MKRTLLFAFVALFTFGCNSGENKTDSKTADSTGTAPATSSDTKYDYPYTLDKPYQDWQPGDQQHAVNVMKGLKAWENNNIAECVTYFGDSVDLRFDNFHAVLPHDSLANFFSAGRNMYASVTIKMDDWESVISRDKKDQWVTLWYKQIVTDKKGKTETLGVTNDAKIVNGKIVVLDEKIQHFPAKK